MAYRSANPQRKVVLTTSNAKPIAIADFYSGPLGQFEEF